MMWLCEGSRGYTFPTWGKAWPGEGMGKRQRPGSLRGFANSKICVPWVSPGLLQEGQERGMGQLGG